MWQPFADLPPDTSDLRDLELAALLPVWEEQCVALADRDELRAFQGRLAREWAIETGIIEGVYNLDRTSTRMMVEFGIRADLIPPDSTNPAPETVAAILQDHLDALESIFEFVEGRRRLGVGFIKQIHAQILRHQDTHTVADAHGNLFEKPLERGAYKTQPNNPIRSDGTAHEYCPPEHVASEVDRMLELHLQHTQRSVAPEVEAAWLHHVFTQIHPFADGNGRVARAIASIVLLEAGLFPLVVTRDQRSRYIDSLEEADRGGLAPLISFFSQLQKNHVLEATAIGADFLPPPTVGEMGRAARDNAILLRPLAMKHLSILASSFDGLAHGPIEAFSFIAADGGKGIFSGVAGQLPCAADPEAQSFSASLKLKSHPEDAIILQFFAIGPVFHGLLAGAVFCRRANSVQLVGEPFLLGYRENREAVIRRFETWIIKSLLAALGLWGRSR